MSAPKVIVSGAGLAGALMATYLGKAGYQVEVYERRGDPRGRDVDAGRSINLALSTRGIEALKGVDVDSSILELAVPMRGRMMHSEQGGLTFQPYGTRSNQVINSVSRLGLNLALIDAADSLPNVKFIFNQQTVDVDLDRPALKLVDGRTGAASEVEADFVLAADGAFSAIRSRFQKTGRFQYQQSYLGHGYKELSIPPGARYGAKLDPNALHIWPRDAYMMIALPNQDGSFTCTLFFPFEGDVSFESLDTPAKVEAFFAEQFPDAVPLMPQLVEEFFENPTSSLVTVRCEPWQNDGKVALIGDACHAIVPFYGQGANAAFEDCIVLDECLREFPDDRARALREFELRRKENVDVLADLAIQNYYEMRDHVNNRWFLIRSRFEKLLHKIMPSIYIPLYIMVTFTRIPYAEATQRAATQWRWVKRVAWTGGLLAGLGLLAVGMGWVG